MLRGRISRISTGINLNPSNAAATDSSYAYLIENNATILRCYMVKRVVIHTDGSCLGNPGPGGWAAVLCLENTEYRRELSGGFALTTNNRMEIIAVLEGLSALREPCEVALFADSQYVCNAVGKKWLHGWHAKNWIKSDKRPVKNADLWQKLLPLLSRHTVRFHWLLGHAGHEENERCDELARLCAARADLPPDMGYVRKNSDRADTPLPNKQAKILVAHRADTNCFKSEML